LPLEPVAFTALETPTGLLAGLVEADGAFEDELELDEEKLLLLEDELEVVLAPPVELLTWVFGPLLGFGTGFTLETFGLVVGLDVEGFGTVTSPSVAKEKLYISLKNITLKTVISIFKKLSFIDSYFTRLPQVIRKKGDP